MPRPSRWTPPRPVGPPRPRSRTPPRTASTPMRHGTKGPRYRQKPTRLPVLPPQARWSAPGHRPAALPRWRSAPRRPRGRKRPSCRRWRPSQSRRRRNPWPHRPRWCPALRTLRPSRCATRGWRLALPWVQSLLDPLVPFLEQVWGGGRPWLYRPHTLLTAFMLYVLSGFRNPEQVKAAPHLDFGPLLGRRRGPACITLRRRLVPMARVGPIVDLAIHLTQEGNCSGLVSQGPAWRKGRVLRGRGSVGPRGRGNW